MLLEIANHLVGDVSFLNVFRYITFRTGGAMLTALIVSFIFGPFIIRSLKKRQSFGQPIRSDGPEKHIIEKKGTPTMGGIMILLAVLIATLLWSDYTNKFIWSCLGITLGYGLIGFIDDFIKVSKNTSDGLNGKLKIILQVLIAGTVVSLIISNSAASLANSLAFPFFKDLLIDLGWFFSVFAVFVIVGSSNAVNLTDGLDGLAIGPIMITAMVFAVISYLSGNLIFSNYLQINYVAGAGELAVFCGALVGAGLGFLWPVVAPRGRGRRQRTVRQNPFQQSHRASTSLARAPHTRSLRVTTAHNCSQDTVFSTSDARWQENYAAKQYHGSALAALLGTAADGRRAGPGRAQAPIPDAADAAARHVRLHYGRL